MTDATSTKSDWELRNNLLKAWEGRRLPVQGVFDKLTTKERGGVVVLAQEIEIRLPTEGWCFLGHMWIQHAETMASFQEGDKFLCTCRVSKYMKKVAGKPEGQTLHNLVYPEDVQLKDYGMGLPGVPGNGPSMAATTPKTAYNAFDLANGTIGHTPNALQVLSRGKALVEAVGIERLREVRDFLQDLGGWEKLEEFLSILAKE